MSALTRSALLLGSFGVAAWSIGANRAAVRLSSTASNAIADRYLAFDDPARDAKISAEAAAARRKWRHASIAQQIRDELNSQLC